MLEKELIPELEIEIDTDDYFDDEEKPCDYRCKDCILLNKFDKHSLGYVGFEKVGDFPEILFVGEAPGQEEIKEGRPFVGKAGKFLRDHLKEIGLKSYWVFNNMQCHPRGGKIRTPEFEEIKHCAKNVKQFINENKPKLVILLGKSAYEGLMPEDFYKGQTVTSITKRKPVVIDGIKYGVCFHPSYITRNGGIKSPQYEDFVEILTNLVTGKYKEEVPTVPFQLKNLDNLKEVLLSYSKETDLGFDYEGTSLSPFSKEFKILGFSLAALNPARATYVDFHRPITESERLMLSMFLENKKPWTYNVNYELKVSWAKITKKFIPFNDAFVLCKIDCSLGRLKDNARKHVGADFWEEMVTAIRKYFSVAFKKMDKIEKTIKLLELKKDPSPKQISQITSFKNLHNSLTCGNIKEIQTLISEDKNLEKQQAILQDISELEKLCTLDQISRGLTKYPNEWEAIPVEMTGEYCCYDSYYTLLLKNHFWEKYKDIYPYYISQAWAGSIMESYGMNWNDLTASELGEYYLNEAVDCLYKIIEMLDFGDQWEVKIKKGSSKKVMKSSDEHKLDAYSIVKSSEYTPLEKLAALKLIFNPISNDKRVQKPFWDLYNTDFVRAISIYYVLEEQILANKNIPDKCLELFDKSDLNKTIQNLLTCDWINYASCTQVQQRNIIGELNSIISKLNQSVDEHLFRFAEPIMIWQFNAHKKYGGLFTTPIKDSGEFPDLKPEKDWCTEFKLLYLLRRFKKVMKNETTYIQGEVGRKNVWLSDVSDFSIPPNRIRLYDKEDKNYKLKPNERWILDTEYNVCGAKTKRWKSKIHTVPANSELRTIYETRNEDTLFFHYDNSQSEIRYLAVLSGDKALLEAFKGNVDIHKYIASKIYKKDVKDVTDVERKNSKSASFALLYGKSIQNFAEELMGGDLAAAEQLFKDFFGAFPDVKKWIESKHKEALETGKVTTMFGDFIILDMRDQNAAMRDAQNHPIQSISSSLAAHCIYLNYDKSKKEKINILPLVFTHDSNDMEIPTLKLFEVIDNVYECAVNIPKREFNVPMKIDLEIGVSQGKMIKFEEHKKESSTQREYEFSGEKSVLLEVVTRLSKHFNVNYTITKEENKFSSLQDMFVPKKAFARSLGSSSAVVSGQISLTRI